MINRELIYKSLDIMEENLKGQKTVFEISQELGFSLYYFSRLFKGVTGESPKSYMLKRTITDSVSEITTTDKKMLDIALDYGFGSSESYSRAFNKIVGVNPSEVRKSNPNIAHKLCPKITREQIERKSWMENMQPELVESKAMYLVGLPFYYDSEMVNDLSNPWNNLIKNAHLIKNKITPERYYQVQYWFENQDEGSIFFFIAVEVSSFDDIPVQFTAKTLPKQKYLKFYHKGFSNKVGETYQYIYEKWLPDSDYKLPHTFNFEYYGPEHLGPYNEESISEIYIPVSL